MRDQIRELFERAVSVPWVTAAGSLDVQYRIEPWGVGGAMVVFQGSVSDVDWGVNFDTAIVPYRDQPVRWLAHRGFVRAWKSARDEIMARLENTFQITILGYSLGAAMAQLCLEDVGFCWPERFVRAYTFGTPRVFWMPPQVVRNRCVGLLRVRNVGDAVASVPPAAAGFRHVGAEYEVGSVADVLAGLGQIKGWEDLPGARQHMIPQYRRWLA